jgi:hypothetical protein
MSNPAPVTLTPVAQPIQARASLTSEQVAAFKALLGGSGLVTFPDGKTAAEVVQFAVTVQPNGGGFLSVSVK